MAKAQKPNKNDRFVVQNAAGSGRLPKCACKSWIKHWEVHTGKDRGTCAVLECRRSAEHGAHVKALDGRMSRQWWIVPFCSSHNHPSNDGPMGLKRTVWMIAAWKKLTCEAPESRRDRDFPKRRR